MGSDVNGSDVIGSDVNGDDGNEGFRVMKREVMEMNLSYQDSSGMQDDEEEEDEDEEEGEDGSCEGQDYPDSGMVDNQFMAKVDSVFSKAKEPWRVKKEPH